MSGVLGHRMRPDSGLLTSHGLWQAAGPPPAEGSRAQGEGPFPRLAGKPGEQVCPNTPAWGTFGDTPLPPAVTY